MFCPSKLQAAVNEGLAQLVIDQVDFASRSVKDTRSGQRLTLAEALDKGVINPARAMVKDTKSGRTMSIDDAVKRQIVDADLADSLQGDSGLRDITGSPLTVLEALKRGLIDPSTGKVMFQLQSLHKTFLN